MGTVSNSGSNGIAQRPTESVSAIVVTFQRPMALAECLTSLVSQTHPPDEILVIDNAGGMDPLTMQVCARAWGIPVRHLPNPQNSLTVARNMGVTLAGGDYVLMVDDDVKLASDYVELLYATMQSDPRVVGLQGHISQGARSRLRETIHRTFRLYHLQPNRCGVLRSISTTYPAAPHSPVMCEWLSGSNQFYRRDVLTQVPWDEQMIMYSDGEDLDHSYRVSRACAGELRLIPTATVTHDESSEGRLPAPSFILMREAYGYYLSHKLFPKSWQARLVFAWSRLGIALITIGRALRLRSLAECRSLAAAFQHVLSCRTELRAGDLSGTNRRLVAPRRLA